MFVCRAGHARLVGHVGLSRRGARAVARRGRATCANLYGCPDLYGVPTCEKHAGQVGTLPVQVGTPIVAALLAVFLDENEQMNLVLH